MAEPEDEREIGSDSGYEHTSGNRDDSDDADSSLSDTRVETSEDSWIQIY